MSRWARGWNGRVFTPLALGMARAGITPDMLTLAGLAGFLAAGVCLALGWWGAGVALIVLGGLADSLDGELARTCASATPLGAFLDSICDHYGDFALYLGLLWWSLARGAQLEVLLIFLALFGSVMGSQVRSRAAMVGVDTRWSGTFTRLERQLVLAVGIVIGQVTLALAVLAVMNNVSALQRVTAVVRASRDHGRKTDDGRPQIADRGRKMEDG